MPLANLRDRGNRLKAFAENKKPLGPIRMQEDVQESDYDGIGSTSTTPTKRNMADAAKLPVPQPARRPVDPIFDDNDTMRVNFDDTGRSMQPPPPAMFSKSLPVDRLEQLLSGSELGDSFMHSGISTPLNEPEDGYEQPQYEERSKTPRGHQTRARQYPEKLARSVGPSFQLGEDLFMSVVTQPTQRYPHDMKDGFSGSAVKNRGLESPQRHHRHHKQASLQQSLPMREVKVHKQYRQESEDRDVRQRRFSSWEPQRAVKPIEVEATVEVESVVSSNYDEEDLQATPRGRTTRSPKRQPQHPISASPVRRVPPAPLERKRRRPSTDYDDRILSSMSFGELQNEPFDFDPSVANAQTLSGTSGGNIESRLAQLEHHGHSEQRTFFGNMTLDEWECAGDWFADRFADIMKKMRQARRNKRQMIQEFENEAAQREAAVRIRSDKIDRKLQTMKENGRRVVGERALR
ncbi:hypothetical protein VHEMI03398 [[Torrubiella] hemipterigena]|uniref:Extracellular mutant protein 11 C-terminal domain-containing protein n=1 Tax=[Torrubiella] hemipterigena TaxID=1531966 RepID=A0A0A1SYD2_9HYPO|nr:hypothetical protein VHEMI03398 [[Torrubiella] hemipterigena]